MPDKQKAINKEIVIKEAIAHLKHFCKLYGIESLFLVGGYCRALYFGDMSQVNDLDVASAFHEQAVQLGGLFASEVIHTAPKVYKRTGTAMVEYESESGSIKIEFQGDSSNAYMHNQEVKDWLHRNGISDIPLMNNIYGRDFTINSLIYSLDNDKVYDPSNKALRDLKRKLITPLLPPEMLIKYNPLAILRGMRFALTHDFYIEAHLRREMKKNIHRLAEEVTHERIVREMIRILNVDAPAAMEMFKNFGLQKILLDEEIREIVGAVQHE